MEVTNGSNISGSSAESAGEDSPLLAQTQEVSSSTRSSLRVAFSKLRDSDSIRSVSSQLLESLSKSHRGEVLKRPGVGAAAFLIRDAVLGVKENPHETLYDPYSASEQEQFRSLLSIVCGRISGNQYFVRLLRASVWIMAILSFIEPPPWCRNPVQESTIDDLVTDDKFGSCWILLAATGPSVDGVDDTVHYYPNSSSMWITVEQSMFVEWICLTIVALFLMLQLGRDGFELTRYFRPGINRAIRVCQCLSVILLFCGLITNRTDFHPFVRLALLASFLRDCQTEVIALFRMLPELVYIMFLLVVITIFYAWFGVVLFYDTPQGQRDFSNLIEAAWTLWICITTANYPDVMMPSYNENRLAGIYFVSFMVISFFFIMNLILASVVNAYDSVMEERKRSRKEIASRNLTQAFKLMDPNDVGHIDRETIMALLFILNEDFPEFKTLSDEETKLLFGFLDRDGSNLINLEEFQDFGTVLLLEFTKASDYATIVETHFPKLFQSSTYQRMCDAVRSAAFEIVVDVALVLNAVVIGIQTYPELAGMPVEVDPHFADGYIDTPWELAETVFTLFYVVEVILKVMVFGWKRYSESPRNMFDFYLTVSALCATAYVYYPNQYNDSRLIRFIVMARVLRLVRLVLAMKEFRVIGTIAIEILPGVMNVILLLFLLMYFFAALGMTLYGGMITRDPSNILSTVILGNDFSDNDYWANNFNDMMSGMNVLFNLLVINNWTECEIGFEAVTGGKWVRFFFLGFHVLGVILVNNLVIAFIINEFFQQLATVNSLTGIEEVNGEALIKGEADRLGAKFDASSITGTKTGASGEYIARIRAVHADVEIDERAHLRKLFTQTSSTAEEK